jgi:hypothetical protein
MGLELDPSRSEARRIVVGLFIYWFLFGLMLFTRSSVLFFVMPVSLIALLVVLWTAMRIATRESELLSRYYFNPFLAVKEGQYWATVREGWGLQARLMSPRWFTQVARKTGWSVPLTMGLLVIALAVGLIGVLQFLLTFDSTSL